LTDSEELFFGSVGVFLFSFLSYSLIPLPGIPEVDLTFSVGAFPSAGVVLTQHAGVPTCNA